MKNKLLVSVFAVGLALAFSSCETRSDVMAVNTDLLKGTLHGANSGTSATRGFVQIDGNTLILAEYEFPSKDVNDKNLLYRTIAFGDGTFDPKKVETFTYEYGVWQDKGETFTLNVTPKSGEPFVLRYNGDALIEPSGRVFGGSSAANVARVEKWEKVIATFPNTDWESTFEGSFVLDSVFRDSIRTVFIPPMTFKTDTIQIFDHMDTVSADTTCYFKLTFDRNATTLANTGHFYSKAVRSKYNRETKEATVIKETITEYDFRWMFTEVSSDKKFVVTITNTAAGSKGEKLSISKFELDDAGEAATFLLDGNTYTRPVLP